MTVVVPWATDSQLGGGDRANIGGGYGKDCYGGGLAEIFKSPRDSLLKKKQNEWAEAKKSPETTVPVPTAFPEKQVKSDRSSFLLGQDSPVDPLVLAERTARRKLASEVQQVLLEQMSERMQKRKERLGNEKATAYAQPEVEIKENPEVKCEVRGGKEVDLIVVKPSGTGNVQLDKNGKAARQLKKMTKEKRKQESAKEREIKVQAKLLEKKKKNEMEKAAAKTFTEKFLNKGRVMLEEAERAARSIFGIKKPRKVSGGLKPVNENGTADEKPVLMEAESPNNVKQDDKPREGLEMDGTLTAAVNPAASMEDILTNTKPVLNEVTTGPEMAAISATNGKLTRRIPTKLPILKAEFRTANYNLPRVIRGTGLRYKRAYLELAMMSEESPETLLNVRKLAGVAGRNGDGVDPPSGEVFAAISSLKTGDKKSKIPVLVPEKRTPSYSPPRKQLKTGLRYVPKDLTGAE